MGLPLTDLPDLGALKAQQMPGAIPIDGVIWHAGDALVNGETARVLALQLVLPDGSVSQPFILPPAFDVDGLVDELLAAIEKRDETPVVEHVAPPPPPKVTCTVCGERIFNERAEAGLCGECA